MKSRRWFAPVLLLACILWLGAAYAADEVPLENIGLRYRPTEGETCLTRDAMDTAALAVLGVDGGTLLDSMTRDGVYLLSILPDGRQISLSVSDKPEGIASRNAFEMTAQEKADFLTDLARRGDYGSAVWKADGYALFTATPQAQDGGALTYANLSLSTLYLNRVYALRMDVIGRDAAQADTDQLLSAAERMLRLGASGANGDPEPPPPQTLTLPDVTVASEPAELTFQRQSCALTLEPVAATLGVTQFTLSGTTVAQGNLRYAVNGRSSSRIKADDQGAFSVTVPNLTPDAVNQIEVTAFKGEQKTVADFNVTVQWKQTPLALETADTVQGDTVTLAGLTLPGTTVTLSKGKGSGRIAVAQDGTFAVTLKLPRVGENAFTLLAQAAGYRRNELSFRVTRVLSEADAVQSLLKQVQEINTEKLKRAPGAYEGRVVRLSGTASALAYAEGSPRFVLTDAQGTPFTVLCDELLRIRDGAAIELLGTLSGTLNDADGSPILTLSALLS